VVCAGAVTIVISSAIKEALAEIRFWLARLNAMLTFYVKASHFLTLARHKRASSIRKILVIKVGHPMVTPDLAQLLWPTIREIVIFNAIEM
jgi:hypothetical protein